MNRATTWKKIINPKTLGTAGAPHNNGKLSVDIILEEKYRGPDKLTKSHPGAMWTSSKNVKLNLEIIATWHTTGELITPLSSIAFWYVFVTVRARRSTSSMVESIIKFEIEMHLRSIRKNQYDLSGWRITYPRFIITMKKVRVPWKITKQIHTSSLTHLTWRYSACTRKQSSTVRG